MFRKYPIKLRMHPFISSKNFIILPIDFKYLDFFLVIYRKSVVLFRKSKLLLRTIAIISKLFKLDRVFPDDNRPEKYCVFFCDTRHMTYDA